MKKQFFEFLKKNRVYRKWVEKYKGNHAIKYNIWLSQTPPKIFISGAFTWDKQIEGYKYWSDLHEKWLTEIKSK